VPLYRVTIKHYTVVAAADAADAVARAKEDLCSIMAEEGRYVSYGTEPIATADDLPAEWRDASIPWGSVTDRPAVNYFDR
jgi:hypothetical protein